MSHEMKQMNSGVCVFERDREREKKNLPHVCFKVSYLFTTRSLKHQIDYKHNLYK